MHVNELDYELPHELIAQEPPADRSASRLLHYNARRRRIDHRCFAELPELLRPGDVLVMNDSRVTPARFGLRKQTGGYVEALFVEQRGARLWAVMLKSLGPLPREPLTFERDPSIRVEVLRRFEDGTFEVEVSTAEPAHGLLDRLGRMPLPPYIRREKSLDSQDDNDRDRYQTVYAAQLGSIAAPTAGLHFTPRVLADLQARGVERVNVTLHVGLGTFKPIEADTLSEHVMHTERYELTEPTCAAINRAKREGRRVVVVGTTSTRVLESQPTGPLNPTVGQTDLFIRPPYAWKHADALITNFHQPRSTLIALVAALVGLDEQRRIYREAIARRYRFLSYGDSSLLD